MSDFDKNKAIGNIGEAFVLKLLTDRYGPENMSVRYGKEIPRNNWRVTDVSEDKDWRPRGVDILEEWEEDGKAIQIWHEVKTDQLAYGEKTGIISMDRGERAHWKRDGTDQLTGYILRDDKLGHKFHLTGTGNIGYIEHTQNVPGDGWYNVIKRNRPPIVRYMWFYARAFAYETNGLALRVDDKDLIRIVDDGIRCGKYTVRQKGPRSKVYGHPIPLRDLWVFPDEERQCFTKKESPLKGAFTTPIRSAPPHNSLMFIDWERAYERERDFF